MAGNIIKKVLGLHLEEKILNGASFTAFISVFFPWIGGEWLGGKMVTYSGLGFFTSFVGIAILMLHLTILLIFWIPLAGGPVIISGRHMHVTRLLTSALATILLGAVWSVLTKFTFEFSRLEIHFGLYVCIIASLVTVMYSFLLLQEEKRSSASNIFKPDNEDEDAPPPPPADPEDRKRY